MTERRVRIVLDSKGAQKDANKFESAMVGAGAASDKTAFSVNKLAKAIGGLVAIQQVTRFFGDAIKTFAGFEQQMSRVRAITRATDEQFVQLTAIAREMGATTEFTASQAAGGLQFLGQAGFTASESISTLPQVLDLATAAGLGLANAADIASNIMSGYGIAATNAEEVTDVLAATASRANTDVSQMGQAMSFVAPVASSLGVEIEVAAAAIGSLSDAGIQGGRAGTSLRRILTSLVNPLGQSKDTLKELGITMEEINPETNNLVDILALLDQRVTEGADAMRIFGEEGGPAFLALTNQLPRLRELVGEIENAEGETKRMAATMRDNLTGDVNTLNSAFQDLQITMVDTFDEDLRESVQDTTNLVRMLSESMDEIGTVVEYLAAIVGTRLAVALTASAIAFARNQAGALAATVQMNAFGQVVARTTVAQNVLNRSLVAGRGALALLGGPVGAALIAGVALVKYTSETRSAEEKTKDLKDRVNELTGSMKDLDEQVATNMINRYKREAAELEKEIARLDRTAREARTGSRASSGWGAQSGGAIASGIERSAASAREELEALNQSVDRLQNAISKDNYGFDPDDDPFEIPGGQKPSVDIAPLPTGAGKSSDDGDDAVQSMQNRTDELQRQLNLRRQITTIYRQTDLTELASKFEQERALEEQRRQEQIANLNAEFERENARRDEQFVKLMEKEELNEEQRRILRQEHKDQELLSEQIFEEQKISIEEQGKQRRLEIAEAEMEEKKRIIGGLGGQIMSLAQGQSKRMFEFGKKAALANAAISGGEAAVDAWKAGMSTGGPWAPAVAASYMTASLLKTGAQIQQLRGMTYSGGGSSNGGGGSGLGSAGARGQSAAMGQESMSDTSAQRENKMILDFRGLDDTSVLTGKMLKRMTKKLKDGADFGRAVYSE